MSTTSPAPPCDRPALVEPDDPGWDDARRAWNLAVDQRPAAVALPGDEEATAAAVRAARARGLRIAPQSTGHQAAALGDLADALLLRTGGLRGVRVEPERRLAHVAAGACWQDVLDAAAPHGLTALAGSSGGVGVAGLTLGGGIGWLARAHGPTCGTLVGARLVTASGAAVAVTAEGDDDVLWALRGGGGGIGVVTELTLRLVEVGPLSGGALVWDVADAPRVLARWRTWTATAPEAVTTSARIRRIPDVPQAPPALRGRAVVAIDGACLGDDDTSRRALRGLRELRPEIDTWAPLLAARLTAIHEDPPVPIAALSEHRLLASLPESGIDAIVEVAGAASDCGLAAVELRHLGGALASPDAPGALGPITAPFSAFAVGPAATPEVAARVRADLDAVVLALEPWSAASRLPTFTEGPCPRDPAVAARLARVRGRWDPEGVLLVAGG